jgi:hypothetical protein
MLYYIVNKSTGRVEICNGKEELISYIASYNCRIAKEKRNLLLENIAMNNNDKKLKYDFYYSKNVLVPRIYMVYDEFSRIVDPRIYQEKILSIRIDPLSRIRNLNPHTGFKSELTDTKAVVEPIARCGNKFRHYFRYAKTANEKRNNAIPEYKQFIRGKRKVSHISPAWDDYDVHTEKNWKRLKIRKQYMKNTK